MIAHAAPEIRLLLACARAAMRRQDCERAADAIRSGVDWPALIALARVHGLIPLLSRHARAGQVCLPPEVASELGALHGAIARRNLRASAVLLDALERLEGADIPSLPLKGPVLAEQAYGSIAMRAFDDLDVLVSQRVLDDAVRVLLGAGFVRDSATGALRAIERRESHHVVLIAPNSGLRLELHGRLVSSAAGSPIDLDGMDGWFTSAPRLGRRVSALTPEALFAYLCVHGTAHAWARIEWIATACEVSRTVVDWNAVRRVAEALGATCRVAAARDLFERVLDAGVVSVAPDAGVNRLIIDRLTSTPARPPGVVEALRYQLRLDDRRSARLRRLWDSFVRPGLADAQALPASVSVPALAYMIRPVRLISRALRRAIG